jgi:hypothetical protein
LTTTQIIIIISHLGLFKSKENILFSDLSALLFEKTGPGDKTWFFQYDPETKSQSLQWETHECQNLRAAQK